MISLRRRITCQEFVDFASAYLDGTLPPRPTRLVEKHSANCPDCHNYLAQLRTTVRLVGALRIDDVPEELLAALERAWLEEQDAIDPRR